MFSPKELHKKRDRSSENFKKTCESLMARGNDIKFDYDADVYILVRRRHRYYEYCSLDVPTWPVQKAELTTTYPLPVRKSSADFIQRRNRRMRLKAAQHQGQTQGEILHEGGQINGCGQDGGGEGDVNQSLESIGSD